MSEIVDGMAVVMNVKCPLCGDSLYHSSRSELLLYPILYCDNDACDGRLVDFVVSIPNGIVDRVLGPH